MYLACVAGKLEVIKILSLYGASRTFSSGETAVSVAAGNGHTYVAKWLADGLKEEL